MAKRKAWQRALGGLGEGISNASQMLLRQQIQDKGNENILRRQIEADNRQFTEQLQQAVAENKITPEQAIAQAAGRGITLDKARLSLVRPTARKRLEPTLGKAISDAKSLEDVPSTADVASVGRSEGEFLPDEFMVPDALTNITDPLLGSSGPLQEYEVRAETRRRGFREKPTERVEVLTPTGGTEVQFISPYAGEVQAKPSAAQQGVFEGDKTKSKLATSGQAEAEQAAREKKATTQAGLDVENAPANVAGSARREGAVAGARSAATTAAEINTKLQNAQKLIDFETQKALAQIQVTEKETAAREWSKSVVDASTAANQALPILGQLRLLWQDAQPELERMIAQSPVGPKELMAQIAQGVVPRSMLPVNVRKYVDLLESARPRLARAMGNVGNFTEGEQQRAGYVAPDFIDAMDGGATGYQKLDRIEQLFMAAPAIAKASRPGGRPLTADQINAIVDQQRRGEPGDVNLPSNQPYDVLLTPSGLVRKPGQ